MSSDLLEAFGFRVRFCQSFAASGIWAIVLRLSCSAVALGLLRDLDGLPGLLLLVGGFVLLVLVMQLNDVTTFVALFWENKWFQLLR